MKNLIPKSLSRLSRQKGIIYKNISKIDVLFVLICAGISFGIFMPITSLDITIRAIISCSLFLPSLVFMIFIKPQNARLYSLVFRWIKFKVNRVYRKSETTILNPYANILNGNVVTKGFKDIKSYNVKVIKIRGFDLTTLGSEESDIKLSQFHSFIVSQKNNFTIAKISESFSFINEKKSLLKEMKKTKEKYDDSSISEKEYKAKQTQQKNN